MRSTRILPRALTGLFCLALIVTLVTVGASPALAGDTWTTGSAPLWVQFNVGTSASSNTTHVSVTVRDQAACGGFFQIFTSGDWGYWDTPTDEDWMGVSTDIGYDMHMWAGELVPGAYYVRLGLGADPSCVVGVSGETVDYVEVVDLGYHLVRDEEPAAAPQPIVMAAPVVAGTDFRIVSSEPASPAPAAKAPAAVAASPALAKPKVIEAEPIAMAHGMDDMHEMDMHPNEWMPVTNNEPMMFTFYVGHEPGGDALSHVNVTLYGAPFRAGSFQIFTSEGVPFDRPEQDDWMGYAIMEDGENAQWDGDLVPGAYYVLVYPEGMRDCLLAVSGPAITY